MSPAKSFAETTHNLEKSYFISSPSAFRDWRQIVNALEDECAAWARLAGWASTWAIVVAGHNDRNWARLASLEMQLRATQLLRKIINQGGATLEDPSTRILPVLYGLFRTEVINQNVVAAAQHAKVLRTFFESGHYTLQLLIQCLCFDVDLAAQKVHRLFFDVDVWFVQAVAPTLSAIAENIPQFQMIDRTIHPSITLPALRQLWLQMHFMSLAIRENPFPLQRWQEQSLGDMAFVYISCRTFIDQGQLINLYMDLTEGRIMEEADTAERYLQAALVCGLLYMCRREGHESWISGVDVRDASRGLMRELRRTLELTWAYLRPEDESKQLYREAFLWLLYIGAVCERHKRLSEASWPCWFNDELKRRARSYEVLKWPQLKAILEQFYSTQLISPNGAGWFEDLVNESCGPSEPLSAAFSDRLDAPVSSTISDSDAGYTLAHAESTSDQMETEVESKRP
jgi:hypothetical protein